mgnify:CR=1 FL=1
MAKNKIAYVCTECGGQSTKWQGQCQHCMTWNTMAESIIEAAVPSRYASLTQTSELKKLNEVKKQKKILFSFKALFVHFFVKRLIFGYHQRGAVVAAVNLI